MQDLARWYQRPYVRQLEELMSPRAAKRIEITGEVSREALIDHYRQADLFVLPSIYAEGFGIPIVEAAGLEVPTVASRREAGYGRFLTKSLKPDRDSAKRSRPCSAPDWSHWPRWVVS